MPEIMGLVEAEISIFHKARMKFAKCKNAETSPHFVGYCKLFHYTMDKSFDYLHHCGSCRANTEEPTINIPVRKR